jgi:hypothetical protein
LKQKWPLSQLKRLLLKLRQKWLKRQLPTQLKRLLKKLNFSSSCDDFIARALEVSHFGQY